jgi:hypothetical protein
MFRQYCNNFLGMKTGHTKSTCPSHQRWISSDATLIKGYNNSSFSFSSNNSLFAFYSVFINLLQTNRAGYKFQLFWNRKYDDRLFRSREIWLCFHLSGNIRGGKRFHERFHRVDEEFCLGQLQKEIVMAKKKSQQSWNIVFYKELEFPKLRSPFFATLVPPTSKKPNKSSINR